MAQTTLADGTAVPVLLPLVSYTTALQLILPPHEQHQSVGQTISLSSLYCYHKAPPPPATAPPQSPTPLVLWLWLRFDKGAMRNKRRRTKGAVLMFPSLENDGTLTYKNEWNI